MKFIRSWGRGLEGGRDGSIVIVLEGQVWLTGPFHFGCYPTCVDNECIGRKLKVG